MLGKPMYSAELRAAEAGLKAFCDEPPTAESIVKLLLLGRNYWPSYDMVRGVLTEGVKLSDLYRILQELGVPGNYEEAIANAAGYENSVHCQV